IALELPLPPAPAELEADQESREQAAGEQQCPGGEARLCERGDHACSVPVSARPVCDPGSREEIERAPSERKPRDRVGFCAMRVLRTLAWFVVGLAIALTSAWCVLAILRAPVGSPLVREELGALFGLVAVGALVGLFVRRWRARTLLAFVVAVI